MCRSPYPIEAMSTDIMISGFHVKFEATFDLTIHIPQKPGVGQYKGPEVESVPGAAQGWGGKKEPRIEYRDQVTEQRMIVVKWRYAR